MLIKMWLSLSILVLLGAVSISSAGSDPSNSLRVDPMRVRAALEHRGRSGATARAAAATSPLLDYSMRGTGVAADAVDGTCSGAACNASGGDCLCVTFQGTLNGTQIGNADWDAALTVNIDDCTNTGTPGPDPAGGFCCFGDGTLNATVSSDTLAMSFTGPVCDDPNANDDTNVMGGFIILTADSAGKFQHSAGVGQLNISVLEDGTSYLAGTGVLQVTSPF